jgi:hypothetical protein
MFESGKLSGEMTENYPSLDKVMVKVQYGTGEITKYQFMLVLFTWNDSIL